MKRFFCKVCKKQKRVRRMPDSVTQAQAYNVTERVGMCSWHVIGRVHVPRIPSTKIKTVTVAVKSQNKRVR